MEERPVRVWVDDENDIFRLGLTACLETPGFVVSGESKSLVPAPDLARTDILVTGTCRAPRRRTPQRSAAPTPRRWIRPERRRRGSGPGNPHGFGWGLSSNNTFGYCDPDHNMVADGVLVQRIERRTQGGKPFSVGCINTRDRFSQLYGYWEVRLRVARCPGARAAFWGKPNDESWPPELDVVEVHGDERHVARLSAHWREGRRIVRSRGRWSGPDFSARWHTFGVEWSPTEIIWYVDGVARRRLTAGASHLDDRGPFYMIVNAQVYLSSSTCGGAGSTQLVDHVRVWSRP